jgi:hypothetical protein
MPSVVNLFRLADIYGVLPHELYPELYENVKGYGKQSTGDENPVTL